MWMLRRGEGEGGVWPKWAVDIKWGTDKNADAPKEPEVLNLDYSGIFITVAFCCKTIGTDVRSAGCVVWLMARLTVVCEDKTFIHNNSTTKTIGDFQVAFRLLFQSESWCEAFHMESSFIHM